jgi:hypothetical protein
MMQFVPHQTKPVFRVSEAQPESERVLGKMVEDCSHLPLVRCLGVSTTDRER